MSKDSALQVEITSDGSPTLFSPAFQAHYHSMHGAHKESVHVFIKTGLEYFLTTNKSSEVSILEFGFGSGLNAILTLLFAEERHHHIYYHGLEAYPIDENSCKLIVNQYPEYTSYPSILHCPWNKVCELSKWFKLYKEHVTFEQFKPDQLFDIVYYDAFAPSCQPDLWEVPILEKAWNSLTYGGVLVTFCAKGSFKRNLKALGFKVERLPGPPGKREMTRAIKM